MSDEIINDCPFCGSTPTLWCETLAGIQYYGIRCENPRCRVCPSITSSDIDGKGKQSVLKMWNPRATPSRSST